MGGEGTPGPVTGRETAGRTMRAMLPAGFTWNRRCHLSTVDDGLFLDGEGRPVMLTTKSYSDGLLVKLLGAFKPERYRDNARLELTGADGGPVVMDDAQRAAKLSSLVALAQARKQAAAATETGQGAYDGSDLV